MNRDNHMEITTYRAAKYTHPGKGHGFYILTHEIESEFEDDKLRELALSRLMENGIHASPDEIEIVMYDQKRRKIPALPQLFDVAPTPTPAPGPHGSWLSRAAKRLRRGRK